jgi:hypothetical protein
MLYIGIKLFQPSLPAFVNIFQWQIIKKIINAKKNTIKIPKPAMIAATDPASCDSIYL